MQKNNDIPYITSLLPQFNARDANTFGEFYSFLYHELYYYTNSLYKSSSQTSEDAIQDAFLYIWEHPSLSFDNLTRLKSYLYLIIRNDFLSSCRKDRITEANRTNYIYEEIFTSHSLQNPKSLQSSPPPLICYRPIVPASSNYSLKAGISAKSLNKPDYLSVLSTQKKTKPYLFSVKNSKKKHSLSSSTFYPNSIIILLHIRVKY